MEGRTFWPGEFFSAFPFLLFFFSSFLLFFFSLFVFFSISSLFAVMTIQRDQDLRTISFVFSHMYQLRHLRIFAPPILSRASASRSSGCVPAIDAIYYYFRSQRGDDAAVVSFLIILATRISSYDDDDTLVRICRPLAPRSRFRAFLGYGYSSSFLLRLAVLMMYYGGHCAFVRTGTSPPPRWVVSSHLPFCVLFYYLAGPVHRG